MRPVAVLFDLDGTLIDSRGSIAFAINQTRTARGLPPLPDQVIFGFVGDGARALVSRAFELPDGSPELGGIVDAYLRVYAENPSAGSTWMPGAVELLDRLQGRPIGLVTNKARRVTEPVARDFGLVSRFDVIVAGGDAPALKPDSSPVRLALDALKVAPSETWIVGDGVQDVRAGRAAGCKTLAVAAGFASREALRAARPLVDPLGVVPDGFQAIPLR